MFFKEKVDNKEVNTFFHLSNKVLRVIFLLVTILLVLVATYLIKEWKILQFLGTIIAIISPVFIGFIIAWLLDPLATKLSKRMPRVVACIIVYLGTFAIIGGILWMVIPSFGNGISEIVNTLPKVVDNAQKVTTDLLDNFKTNPLIGDYEKDILVKIEQFGKELTETLPQLIFEIGKSILSGGTSLILGIMLGFYILFDFRKCQGHILSFMPDVWHENASDLMHRINGKLRNYVQSVFIVMFLVFITQAIGLSLAGLKAPVVFALFCAITDIIPYIGPWIGGLPAVIVGFTINPMTGILTLIAIVVCQTLENNFYQPLIMGKTMKLHPVTIMLGLLLFSHFFGMIGMIVATPAIASLKIIYEFIEEKTGFGEKFHNYQKKDIEEEAMTKKSTVRKRIKES